MNTEILSLSARPDMAPAIAAWLLDQFRHARSPSHGEQVARLVLVTNDLPSRPDLTPWLASVLVRPQFRGRGYSAPLIRRVEAADGSSLLWLYTWTAEPLYACLGWERVGLERDTDRNIEVVLMKRDLR